MELSNNAGVSTDYLPIISRYISPEYKNPNIDNVSNVFHLLFQPQNLCDIDAVCGLSVSREDEVHRKVDIALKDPDKEVDIVDIVDIETKYNYLYCTIPPQPTFISM